MNIDKEQVSKLGAVNSTGSIGMKYDGDKQLANILFQDFPRALEAVVAVATFGANKYQRNSWTTVPNAMERYSDAMVRHQLAMGRGEAYDHESRLLHYAHFAWNALATLELLLRQGQAVEFPPVFTTPILTSTVNPNPINTTPIGSGTAWISNDPIDDPLGR